MGAIIQLPQYFYGLQTFERRLGKPVLLFIRWIGYFGDAESALVYFKNILHMESSTGLSAVIKVVLIIRDSICYFTCRQVSVPDGDA